MAPSELSRWNETETSAVALIVTEEEHEKTRLDNQGFRIGGILEKNYLDKKLLDLLLCKYVMTAIPNQW